MKVPDSWLPPIVLAADEVPRLMALSSCGMRTAPEAAEFLEGELARARVLPPDSVPPGTVRMGSRVVYRDDGSQKEIHAELVYPGKEDVERRRVSILSPVGAALIGLAAGQSIVFTTPFGRRRKLTVVRVEEPEPVSE